MAVQTADILKGWFSTGKKPTQQQFYDLIESCINGVISMADVTGLLAALNTKVDKTAYDAFEQGQLISVNDNYTYAIPAGYLLEKIIPYYGEAGSIELSLVGYNAGDVSSEDDEIAEGWNSPIELNIVAEEVTNLYITGPPAGSKIIFLKRKLKMA